MTSAGVSACGQREVVQVGPMATLEEEPEPPNID